MAPAVALSRQPLVRHVATLQVGAAAAAGIGFVGSALLARALGSSEYGLYALAFSAVSLTALLTDLGQNLGAVTLWAEAVALGSLERAGLVGAYVLRTSLISSGIVFLAALLLAPLAGTLLYHEPRLGLLVIVLLGAKVWGPALRIPLIALQVTRRMPLLVTLETADLLLRSTLSVLAALAGFGALGAVVGQAVGGLAIAGAAVALYLRLEPAEPRLPSLRTMLGLALRGDVPMRHPLGFGLSVVLERDLRIVANSLPPLLLGLVAPTAEVGVFRVALSYMTLPTLLHEPLTRVLMVTFPQTRTQGAQALGAAYWRSTTITAGGVLLVALGLAAVAPWVVPLVYGREYATSGSVALLLGLAAAAGGLNATNIPLLRSLNRVLPTVWLGAVALLASLAPMVWLIGRYGAFGAAAAYSLGAVVLALTSQWVAWRALASSGARPGASRAADQDNA